MHQRSISVLGETNARSSRRRFGIYQEDRLAHLYLIGKTGTGKTTLMETLLRQDIAAGRGCALIDPHGDLAERVARFARTERPADVIEVDLANNDGTYSYNPILRVSDEHKSLVASGLIDILKKLWSDAWGVRMEHVLRNALLALLDQPRATLADVLPLLTDKQRRREMLAHVRNEQVRLFWQKEFPSYSYRYQTEGIAPILNKVGAFLADPKLRRFLTSVDRGLRLRTIMDEGRILIVNLAQGRLGSDSSFLLGGLLVTAMGSAAFSRAAAGPTERAPFFLYVDEFQSFTTLALAGMLSELRKYGLGLVIAHQYLGQLEPKILDAVLGNVGTTIVFRLGARDAAIMAKEFDPVFIPRDIVQLPNRNIFIRLMVDGAPLRPFSATTLSPEDLVAASIADGRFRA